MNVLAVVAHPDDELLGCGATLRRLANEGHDVYSVVLCSQADARHSRPELERLQQVAGESSRMVGIKDTLNYDFPNIRFNTVPHLEMVKAVEDAIVRFRPEWIFAHHPGDLNVDHRVAYEATMSAVRLPQRMSRGLDPSLIRKVFLFEVLSSTDWAMPIDTPFRPNAFFDVRATFEDKMAALEAFEGALKPYPHSRSAENVRHLAHVRGAQIGIELAEAFSLVHDVYLQPQPRGA
ncbi:MAG TPA: PIG-L deacetylase family protein [Longimicrobium sp.]|nr:PIG-L deacetylase family protein [Longimicrobium sp.]